MYGKSLSEILKFKRLNEHQQNIKGHKTCRLNMSPNESSFYNQLRLSLEIKQLNKNNTK